VILNRTFGDIALVTMGLLMIGCGNVRNDGPPGDDAPVDGSVDGSGVCEASAALRCEGTTLVSCNGDGTAEVQTPCQLRCNAGTLACENAVDPSNGLAAQLDAAFGQPALDVTTGTLFSTVTDFDSNTGTITIGGQQFKAQVVAGSGGAPDILAISVGSMNVAANVTLNVQGERPAAILSAGNVTIAGTILVIGGAASTPEACFGQASGAAGADNDIPGAGGGGFGTAGANGGPIIGIATGKLAGGTAGAPTLIPLRGGCPGGGDGLGGPGRGGGSIQITSATQVSVSGAIGANGGGGVVSSGGGSGGGILVEAPTVSLAGGVFANGGGGGCGGFSAGSDGANSTTPASGADCGGNAGTAPGGNGGAGTTAPTVGGSTINRNATVDRAGGGGGAVGRIRINTLDASITGSGTQSPPASVGAIASR